MDSRLRGNDGMVRGGRDEMDSGFCGNDGWGDAVEGGRLVWGAVDSIDSQTKCNALLRCWHGKEI